VLAVQMSRAPSRIFLSHSSSDKTFARELANELSQRGASVWVDEQAVAPGDDLAANIAEAIRGSDLVLVLLSPSSVRSQWVRRELELALASSQRTRVVPVTLGKAELPQELGDLRGLLYLDAEGHDVAAIANQLLTPSPRTVTRAEGSATVTQEVEKLLSALGVAFEREPSLAGVRPDFLAEMPDGRRLVIEVKNRSNPSLLEAVDGLTQAVHLRELTGADDALVVFPEPTEALPSAAGVVGLAQLESYLRRLIAPSKPPRAHPPSRPSPSATASRRTVFASMPFKAHYDDVYWVAMTAGAEAVGASCVRVDRADFDGDIPSKIKELIESSIAVIADLSESNPDVLFEVGYARRHGCPCVQICSTSLEELPFNVRNISTLRYASGQIHALRQPLIDRLRAVLADGAA
jgi:hypothetical protein